MNVSMQSATAAATSAGRKRASVACFALLYPRPAHWCSKTHAPAPRTLSACQRIRILRTSLLALINVPLQCHGNVPLHIEITSPTPIVFLRIHFYWLFCYPKWKRPCFCTSFSFFSFIFVFHILVLSQMP